MLCSVAFSQCLRDTFVYGKDSITYEENVFVILFLHFRVCNQSEAAEHNDEEHNDVSIKLMHAHGGILKRNLSLSSLSFFPSFPSLSSFSPPPAREKDDPAMIQFERALIK